MFATIITKHINIHCGWMSTWNQEIVITINKNRLHKINCLNNMPTFDSL